MAAVENLTGPLPPAGERACVQSSELALFDYIYKPQGRVLRLRGDRIMAIPAWAALPGDVDMAELRTTIAAGFSDGTGNAETLRRFYLEVPTDRDLSLIVDWLKSCIRRDRDA